MQRSFIGSLMELAESDDNILYLTADSGEGGLDAMFRRNFPDRVFDFGIAEGNMVAAAAGLAITGKIPFVYTAAPFLCYRAYEFIRNDVCLQKLPVKLVGSGSGITTSALGPTHHSTEDISVLAPLPGLKILSPATPKQAYESIIDAYNYDGPVYIRLGMNGERELFNDDYHLVNNKMDVVREGSEITIFVTGSIIDEAIKAAEILWENGISVAVINVSTIKPIDKEEIVYRGLKSRIICSVEEHNVIGGLGSLIAEILYNSKSSSYFIKIGSNDCFAKGYGNLSQVRKENRLDADSIAHEIISVYKQEEER